MKNPRFQVHAKTLINLYKKVIRMQLLTYLVCIVIFSSIR